MKTLLLFALPLFLAANANATGNHTTAQPVMSQHQAQVVSNENESNSTVVNNLDNIGNSVSSSTNSNKNYTHVEGSTLTAGDAIIQAGAVQVEGPHIGPNTMSNTIGGDSINVYQPRGFINYQAPLGEVKVGDVSVTTAACGFTLGYNNEKSRFGGNGGAVAGGCSIPIGGAGKAIDTATRKLEYDLYVLKADEARAEALHEIEIVQIVDRHEVEMSQACVLLHKAGATAEPGFASICSKVGFTDDHHRPMEDNPNHSRISAHK